MVTSYFDMRDRDTYFMAVAWAVAHRSTCLDKKVGCVLVDYSGNILSTGYNGPPSGVQHCIDMCSKEIGKPCRAAHAEQNALIDADPSKVHTAYITLSPCLTCTSMLMNTACTRVVFDTWSKKSADAKELWLERMPKKSWVHNSLGEHICLPNPSRRQR